MFMKLWEFILVNSRYRPFLERIFGMKGLVDENPLRR